MARQAAGPDVRAFSDDALYEAFSGARFSEDRAAEHGQARYLYRYLTDIRSRTMVVEPEYVDGDFLADFASYYVSCFEPYQRFCRRLHFFEIDFGREFFAKALLDGTESPAAQRLRDAYLGFVVVRPLPNAVVGRTALRPYPPDNGRRHYTATVPYAVSLYGLDLGVESLAYQEQDTVLAACATVAIWSALHRTAHVFKTRTPRPPIITADATRTVLYNRALPSTGLRLEQMMAAIRAADLDPEVYEPLTSSYSIRPLSSLIYAYSKGRLPVIVVVGVGDIGQHAVTVTGFSLMEKRVFSRELPEELVRDDGTKISQPSPLPMRGLRINEFYAHDDGVGPFSRLKVTQPGDGPLKLDSKTWRTRFEGQWFNPDGVTPREMLPTCIIVPVYQKIRLSFDVVMIWLNRIHQLFLAIAAKPEERVEWDVYVCETKDYKREVSSMKLTNDRKRGLLLSPQPRFIWRAIFRIDDEATAELLLDATSFPTAFALFAVNFFDNGFAEQVGSVVETGILNEQLTSELEDMLRVEVRQRETDSIGMPAAADNSVA